MHPTKTPQLLFGILLFAPVTALAAPMNPWQAPMNNNQWSVSPMVVSDGGSAEGAFSASVGAGNGIDLNVTAGAPLSQDVGAGEVEFMPRFFVSDSIGFAVRAAGSAGGLSYVVPELHGVLDTDRFDFTVNAGIDLGVGGSGGEPSFIGIVAPELWLNDRISTFVELDATAGAGTAAADLLPGVSANIDPEGVHGVCLALGLPLGPEAGPAYGAFWYALTFDAPGRSARPSMRTAGRGADPAPAVASNEAR
jgi:hypothetical protein